MPRQRSVSTESRATPPTYAKRNAEDVVTAELLKFKLYHPPKRRSAAQRLGLKYEKDVCSELLTTLDPVKGSLLFQPAFRFNAGRAFDEHAIPDIVYLAPSNVITIFEIKLKHTADAWYQLRKLYRPIVAKAYPGHAINLCEVCKWYDPSIKLIGETEIVDNLWDWTNKPQTGFGIYIWSER